MIISLLILSFAKVNLSLRILAKRPDNYHEIQTVLQTVSLHDRLNLVKTSGGKIVFTCDDPAIPVDGSNLVVRAAEALREKFRVTSSCEIHLAKRIPVQAGLGGGSSNAAVTLRALTRLWNLPATTPDLLDLAATLGADVPFFIEGGCALATGIGTDLTPLPDLPQQHHRGNPAWLGGLDAFMHIRLESIELRRPCLPRSVARCSCFLQVPPDRIPRTAKFSRDPPNSHALSGHDSNLHCLLLGQHCPRPKSRDHRPGGSFLFRRSGSVLLRR